MSGCKLKQFITNVLDGKDERIMHMSKDVRARCREMAIHLNVTEKTFQKTLEGICNDLFTHECTTGTYVSLLTFCIELDEIHMDKSSWYRRDVMVDILITELLKAERKKNSQYLNSISWYSILLVISIVLLW